MSHKESLNTLIALHLDGALSTNQCDRLATLLKESQAARSKFWQAVHIHHAAVELADRQWGQISAADDSEASTDPDSIDSIFPAPFSFENQKTTDSTPIGFKDVFDVLAHQLKQTAGKHRVALATAALIAIAGTIGLALLLNMPGKGTTHPIALDDPAKQVAPTIAPNPVATLTATHNAQWSTHSAGGASALPALGTQLHPNDRLTLTAGFAEITTKRGAVAILEAPATVELLDNDNALQLHSGKLVGLCHTPSSKGFVVKTEHAVITDLGTEFGVEVNLQRTQAVVFEGSVEFAEAVQSFEEQVPSTILRRGWISEATASGLAQPVRLADHPLDDRYVALRGFNHSELQQLNYRRTVRSNGSDLFFDFDNTSTKSNQMLIGLDRALSKLGRFGSCASFNGAGEIEIAAEEPINLTSGFTVEAWLWIEAEGEFRERLISNFDQLNPNNFRSRTGFGVGFQYDTDGKNPKPMYTRYGVADYLGDTPLPTRQWFHFALVIDENSQPRFVINGKPQATKMISDHGGPYIQPADARKGNGPLLIGNSRQRGLPHSEAFRGRIDELAIYLSPLELDTLQSNLRASLIRRPDSIEQ